MKALICNQWAPPEALVLEDRPDPTPGDNDAVVRVHAAGVNFPDTLIVQGKYQFKPEFPFSPGGECAGVIESVGAKVKHVKPGDKVICFTGWGAFAQLVVADARAVLPMPEGLDFVTASSFVMTYATSYHALKDRAKLKAGETLLVLGASGGVGLAAIEIGKVLGAKVIAAASSAEKLAVCKEHGADELIDYSKEDLKERLKVITGGKGVDVTYDPVGGPYTEVALRSTAWRGRLLVIGFANGEIPKIPINLALLKGCDIVGVFWGTWTAKNPALFVKSIEELLDLYAKGKIKPHVSERFTLENGADAIAHLGSRKAMGKVVVTVD